MRDEVDVDDDSERGPLGRGKTKQGAGDSLRSLSQSVSLRLGGPQSRRHWIRVDLCKRKEEGSHHRQWRRRSVRPSVRLSFHFLLRPFIQPLFRLLGLRAPAMPPSYVRGERGIKGGGGPSFSLSLARRAARSLF